MSRRRRACRGRLGFWGTSLWGMFIFAAFFIGQLAVIVYFLLRYDGPLGAPRRLCTAVGCGLPSRCR